MRAEQGKRSRCGAKPAKLVIEIRDRGPGFEPGHLADGNGHLGLLGMRERVQSLGGTFEVTSAPGFGTQVIACLPLTRAGEGENGRQS